MKVLWAIFFCHFGQQSIQDNVSMTKVFWSWCRFDASSLESAACKSWQLAIFWCNVEDNCLTTTYSCHWQKTSWSSLENLSHCIHSLQLYTEHHWHLLRTDFFKRFAARLFIKNTVVLADMTSCLMIKWSRGSIPANIRISVWLVWLKGPYIFTSGSFLFLPP